MRTIVLTGGSDGIGAAAAEILTGGGDRLILVGRSPEKTRAVAERVGAEHHIADFERLDEVRGLASTLLRTCDRIDVLANNAGGMFSGPTPTADGFEKTFQVNHLAPYLLTNLLIGRLLESRGAVVATASVGARVFGRIDLDDIESVRRFRPNRAYGNGKLANILFTRGLHQRFHGEGLSSVAFHPGIVATSFASDTSSRLRWMYHGLLRGLLTSPEQGGAILASFAAGDPGIAWQSGQYYDDRHRISRTNPQASDPVIIREHWERSAELLGVRW